MVWASTMTMLLSDKKLYNYRMLYFTLRIEYFLLRPFERTLTLHKDSVGHIGFQFKNGKIIGLVKDSSAARNGLLTEHYLLEVNGQNVVGIKDKEISALIEEGGPIITVTVIPSFVYDHMIKK
jgi:syntenin-1